MLLSLGVSHSAVAVCSFQHLMYNRMKSLMFPRRISVVNATQMIKDSVAICLNADAMHSCIQYVSKENKVFHQLIAFDSLLV